jgi:lipopolysaccharide assembly outer membrane protein LptD (OstA)
LGEEQSEFSFTGRVEISAQSFSATCTAAKVVTLGKPSNLTSSLDSVKEISLTGPLDFRQGERSFFADHAEITTANTTITFSGNVRLTDPMGTVFGGKARVNYKTKAVEISGANDPVGVFVSSSP